MIDAGEPYFLSLRRSKHLKYAALNGSAHLLETL
jgi:hypothetical protein